MRDYQAIIRDYFVNPLAKPLRPKELALELGLGKNDFKRFKDAVEELVADGKLLMGKNKLVRSAAPVNTIPGTIKRTGKGTGYFRPHDPAALETDESLYISPEDLKDAYTGDEVLVQLLKRRDRGQRCGRVVEIISRGSQAFVGTYFERRDHGFVRIDGSQFEGPISVGDPGAKGVLPEDRVVVEMLRFPGRDDAGEAVITKVLGPRGTPGVDLQTILVEFGLPDEFPEAVLAEARLQAQMFEAAERRESGETRDESQNVHPASSLEDRRIQDAEPNEEPLTLTLSPQSRGEGTGEQTSSSGSRLSPLDSRLDLTNELIITIDPVDARDFDDAISLTREDDGNWRLGVHIADVAHFVRPGTLLDREAQLRGTSVYLPDKVLPMLPEVISNALASLQAGRVRYTKSAFITFSPEGVPLHSEFANSKISVTQRFAYEQVMPLIAGLRVEGRRLKDREEDTDTQSSAVDNSSDLQPSSVPQPSTLDPQPSVEPRVLELLQRMHTLAMILRKRRFKHGALDLNLPEVKIDMTRDGTVAGAHRSPHDESHEIIEEFMLAANIAVATRLTDLGLPFLRRNHDSPDELKLRVLGEFAKSLGYKTKTMPGRADLQKLLGEVRETPHEYAISYAILRSMKQAVYGPEDDIGHYALAEANYCHFTSPIRRYPDLTIHRLLDEVITGKRGAGNAERGAKEKSQASQSDSSPSSLRNPHSAIRTSPFPGELVQLGKWCSMTERRAQDAERELIKLKLLGYLAGHIGEEMHATITGVEKFGLFCTGIELPAEGLVHISTMQEDHYDYDDRSHTLVGRRSGHVHRLGDFVRVTIARVDLAERKLELRLIAQEKAAAHEGKKRREREHSPRQRPLGKKPSPPKGRRWGKR